MPDTVVHPEQPPTLFTKHKQNPLCLARDETVGEGSCDFRTQKERTSQKNVGINTNLSSRTTAKIDGTGQ
jgi:hypothetical protein